MKFVKRLVVGLIIAFGTFGARNLQAAEMQSLSPVPVKVPVVSFTSPETVAPSSPVLPPASPTDSSYGQNLPVPETPVVSVPAGESAPTVSQPLRGVSPETIAEADKKIEEEGFYFNISNGDLTDVIKQVARALGKSFILDDKVGKGKVTIISERKMTKDEIWEAFQSALEVNNLTIVQGPAGLLRIVPLHDALSNPIDLYTDETPFSDRFITRLVTLKNISANDMATVIKGLISKEGNLYAYPVTNTLIITDTGTNITRLLKLINELDQEGPQEVLEIIPVLYADVKDLAGKITQIFETDSSGAGGNSSNSTAKKGGKDVPALEETPRLRKVIPDDRTNSLIVLASKMAIQKVRDLIRKLDSPMVGDSGEVHVYYLKHASAKDMTAVLNAISNSVQQGKDKKTGPGASSAATTDTTKAGSVLGGAEFVGKFTVNADESTNALVITAGAKDYNTLVEQVISKLDIPRKQVYVEAVIVELDINQDLELGADILGGKNLNLGGNTIALFGSTLGLNPTLLSNLTSLTGAGAASSQSLTINAPGSTATAAVTTGTTTTGTTATTVPAFLAALQFQQGNTDVNILSTPNLLTLDNQEAEIEIGEKVPFPSSTQVTAGGVGTPFTTFTREDVTLKLKIKPQISEGNNVRMEVTQSDDEIEATQPASAAEAGPSTTHRNIHTFIVAQDSQTIVLGGLIKDEYSNVITKVPFLGDIPILGWLFKSVSKTKEKVNLLVFMTPHIIHEPKDFLAILQRKLAEQNTFIAQNFGHNQQKQIHESFEVHAANLLKFQKEYNPSSETPPPPSDLTTKTPQTSQASPAKPEELVPPPPAPAAGNEDDTDLAIGNEKSSHKQQ